MSGEAALTQLADMIRELGVLRDQNEELKQQTHRWQTAYTVSQRELEIHKTQCQRIEAELNRWMLFANGLVSRMDVCMNTMADARAFATQKMHVQVEDHQAALPLTGGNSGGPEGGSLQ